MARSQSDALSLRSAAAALTLQGVGHLAILRREILNLRVALFECASHLLLRAAVQDEALEAFVLVIRHAAEGPIPSREELKPFELRSGVPNARVQLFLGTDGLSLSTLSSSSRVLFEFCGVMRPRFRRSGNVPHRFN